MGDPTVLRALCLAAAFLTLTPAASGEIFRCTTGNGVPLYQNFPCGAEAPASVPTAVPAKSAPPIKSIQTDGAPAPAVSARAPATAATAAQASASEPRVGMKADEARALWGEPAQIVQDEPRSGRVEIWQYDDGRVVEINHKQRVISVTRAAAM